MKAGLRRSLFKAIFSGSTFPDFETDDQNGEPFEPCDAARVRKVVVIHVCAAWCGRCRWLAEDHAAIAEQNRRLKRGLLTVIGDAMSRDHATDDPALAGRLLLVREGAACTSCPSHFTTPRSSSRRNLDSVRLTVDTHFF